MRQSKWGRGGVLFFSFYSPDVSKRLVKGEESEGGELVSVLTIVKRQNRIPVRFI